MKSPYNRSCRSSAVQFVSQYTWPQNIFILIGALQHSKRTNRSQAHLNFVCITSTSNNAVFVSQVPSTLPHLSFLLRSLSFPQILRFLWLPQTTVLFRQHPVFLLLPSVISTHSKLTEQSKAKQEQNLLILACKWDYQHSWKWWI